MARRSSIQAKSLDQIRSMRAAGLIVGQALAAVKAAARPGMTTADLDQVAREFSAQAGAESSFLGYGGGYGTPAFPAVTCISVNDAVVHGIPGPQVLAEGDLVSVDFGVSLNGWHGDSAITFGIGELSPEAAALSEATRGAMWDGIAAARVGGHIGDISNAIERSVRARDVRYGLVTEFTGHGIGTEMHQSPDVPNAGRAGRGELIVKGTCLAIEPMVTAGSSQVRTLADGWTVVTKDHRLAAHWEHTIAITPAGVWVLTALDGGEAELSARGVRFGALGE